jgi:hypothetical protein
MIHTLNVQYTKMYGYSIFMNQGYTYMQKEESYRHNRNILFGKVGLKPYHHSSQQSDKMKYTTLIEQEPNS